MPIQTTLEQLIHHALSWRLALVPVGLFVLWWYFLRTVRRPLDRDTRLAYLALRHPEPVASWVRVALSHVDQGGLLLDADPDVCREMLARDWGVEDERSLRARIADPVTADPISAWDGLRAIRLAHAGACAGYYHEDVAWDVARLVAMSLQEQYEGFEDVQREYTTRLCAWRATPSYAQLAREAPSRLAAAKRRNRVDFRCDVLATLPPVLPPGTLEHHVRRS